MLEYLLRATTTPSPSPSSTSVGDEIGDALTKDPEQRSGWVDWLVGAPLRILVILAVGIVLLVVLRRLIASFTERIAREPRTDVGGALLRVTNAFEDERRVGRARTLGSVLRSTLSIVVGSIVVMMILNEIGVNLAPLLASAGVAGVALGFGAQSLVKDFLSGIFMLAEDQYGVGDTVNFGDVTGTVEEVALRVTKVRDFDGTLWYLRNGEILRTGNLSQGWVRAMADFRVPYDVDTDLVRSLLTQAAEETSADADINRLLLAPPEVFVVELTDDHLLYRIQARTNLPDRPAVVRALRTRGLTALTGAGIRLVTANRLVVQPPPAP
ncbi:mechanosensitive ion channel family protein [Flavimobilis sp. GY10621]|uniref:Mechanosensitive ion channel family protein n=1 Tax=Flavimobilis rhizosphaerae TaxID=2775421 RepID=A0ABR9DU41_9MICO|nr:mechanosensitive ion channel family protein [Flavimobilis rhizosphaerae]MBD9700449.1 mechanosensitive ion channel family protein [Flavimobilis rhizosphaerae]